MQPVYHVGSSCMGVCRFWGLQMYLPRQVSRFLIWFDWLRMSQMWVVFTVAACLRSLVQFVCHAGSSCMGVNLGFGGLQMSPAQTRQQTLDTF
jgi:hypothetical protein